MLHMNLLLTFFIDKSDTNLKYFYADYKTFKQDTSNSNIVRQGYSFGKGRLAEPPLLPNKN